MDGAGGHGTAEAIEKYTKALKDAHNIVIVLQVPQSPETNVLDLGIWMSLLSAVEKAHGTRSCASAQQSRAARVKGRLPRWSREALHQGRRAIPGRERQGSVCPPALFCYIGGHHGENVVRVMDSWCPRVLVHILRTGWSPDQQKMLLTKIRY